MWNSLDPQDSLDQLGRNLPEIAWSALFKPPMAVEAVDTSAISENTMQQHPRRGVKQKYKYSTRYDNGIFQVCRSWMLMDYDQTCYRSCRRCLCAEWCCIMLIHTHVTVSFDCICNSLFIFGMLCWYINLMQSVQCKSGGTAHTMYLCKDASAWLSVYGLQLLDSVEQRAGWRHLRFLHCHNGICYVYIGTSLRVECSIDIIAICVGMHVHMYIYTWLMICIFYDDKGLSIVTIDIGIWYSDRYRN